MNANPYEVVEPSTHMQALLPSRRIEEIIVAVAQCPAGAETRRRALPLMRPRKRVMFVFAPDSSRKTSLSEFGNGCSPRHLSRRSFTLERSCSLARRVFLRRYPSRRSV